MDKICSAIERSVFPEAAQFGTISGFIDNDDVNKINNTFTGHAYDLMMRSVIYEGVLSITKALDRNGNSLSIFSDGLAGKEKVIEDRRRSAHPDWDDAFLGIDEIPVRVETFRERVCAAKASKAFTNLTTFRDTNLAHRLDLNDKIERLSRTGHIYSAPTNREILDFGRTIIELSAEAASIWAFKTLAWQDMFSRYEKYTRNIFRDLPALK